MGDWPGRMLLSAYRLSPIACAEARMGEIDERIERGVAIYRRAGDDSALLGAALLAFLGAIELQIDAELAEQPTLGERERGLLEQGRMGWLTRASTAE